MIVQPDASPRNWGYWAEKYGTIRALELYYPETLRSSPEVSSAAKRLREAEAEIHRWFREKDEAAGR